MLAAASLTAHCTLFSGEPAGGGLELPVRAVLTPTSLTVQDAVPPACDPSADSAGAFSDSFYLSGLPVTRELSLMRDHRGSFGFSVRGGSESGLPVLVSRVVLPRGAGLSGVGGGKVRGSKVRGSQALFVGDAILRIDQVVVEGATHDEAVARLRNAGQQVTLLVRHYRQAARLLLGTSSSRRSQPPTAAPAAQDAQPWMPLPRPTRVAAAAAHDPRRWANLMTVPLQFARIRCHAVGTDRPRSDCLEVAALSGHSTGCLCFGAAEELANWRAAVAGNIRRLADGQVAALNVAAAAGTGSAAASLVHYMGWLALTLHESPLRSRLWQDVFVAMRGEDLLMFELPPVLLADWSAYSLKEKLFRCVIRVLGQREQLDRRGNAFFLHVGGTDTFYMCAHSSDEVARLERSWFKATAAALVARAARDAPVVFKVACDGETGTLSLDLSQGVRFRSDRPDHLGGRSWRRGLSCLRRTRDDRDATLYLHFADPADRGPLAEEVRTLRVPDLQLLLIVLHAFLSSKLAAVDPDFLRA